MNIKQRYLGMDADGMEEREEVHKKKKKRKSGCRVHTVRNEGT